MMYSMANEYNNDTAIPLRIYSIKRHISLAERAREGGRGEIIEGPGGGKGSSKAGSFREAIKDWASVATRGGRCTYMSALLMSHLVCKYGHNLFSGRLGERKGVWRR